MDQEMRAKILSLLDEHRIMTVATVRPDGWPQATTVGYAHDDLTLYFLCGQDSQKARNIAGDDRVSLTIDHDTQDVMAITGLSMAARAEPVGDHGEAARVIAMLLARYPAPQSYTGPPARPGGCADLPADADGHFRARLFQGIRTRRPRLRELAAQRQSLARMPEREAAMIIGG